MQGEPTANTTGQAAAWPQRAMWRLVQLVRENKLFTWALGIGAALRLFAVLGYPGALWFSGDSFVYLGAALRPSPNLSKSTGYSFFLRLLLPFHSLTLVAVLQHLMGLGDAVMIYALLRHNKVSKKWATIASLPMLLDGYIIEDEHLVMTEALFTFLLMAAMMLILWRPTVTWWKALLAGLLIGYAAIVRTEGAVILVIFPLFLLFRGWGWKNLRGWGTAILMCVGILVPVGGYASWFHSHTGHYNVTLSDGFFLWGRVSSFANCAIIKPTGAQAKICPTQPIADRTPPGSYVWSNPYVHQDLNSTGGPVTYANNNLLTDFAIHAVEAQPLDYVKTVVKDIGLSFGFPRIAYPGAGTTYYYSFHVHYVTSTYNLLPPKNEEWIGPDIPANSAYADWLNYSHQAPGVVDQVFADPILIYQRVVFTYGPLLALIFLVGLGGVFTIRRNRRDWKDWKKLRLRWEVRGTSMLPWITAVGLLVAPIAIADFDYRYLIPVIPFACAAAGLAFAPSRKTSPATGGDEPQAPAEVETTLPHSVA